MLVGKHLCKLKAMLRGFMSTTVTFWPTNLQKVLPHLRKEEHIRTSHSWGGGSHTEHRVRQSDGVSASFYKLPVTMQRVWHAIGGCTHAALHAAAS